MTDRDGFNRAGAYLRTPVLQSLGLQQIGGHRLSVTRARTYDANHGPTDEHILEDAFMLGIQLRDYHGRMWVDGKRLPFAGQPAGSVMAYDYRRNWIGGLDSAFDCVNYHMPRAALNAVIDDGRRGTLQDLRIKPGIYLPDPITAGLTNALLPALAAPQEANTLFVDHVGWALARHVVESYGDVGPARTRSTGRLAPWQERKAKELIDANLCGEIGLAEIASECGISSSHFARAFRRTTGLPPHQWLLHRRVEKAKALLLDARLSLAEVAAMCGFADQSHMARVFARAVGDSPGVWRRSNLT